MIYKAVVFDMNGVLIDDEKVHEEAFANICISELGIVLNRVLYTKLCTGLTDEMGLINILKHFGIEVTEDKVIKLVKQKHSAYIKAIPKKLSPVDGVVDVLENIYTKIAVGLYTNSSRENTDYVLKRLNLKKYFDVIITNTDVKNGKPAPDGYALCSKRFNIPAHKTVVIEDTNRGIKAAKSAGMKCIAITTTHTKEELEGYDFIATSYKQVMKILIPNS